MKKILLLSIISVFLMSCGGGWSSEEKEKAMKNCEEVYEKETCECVLDAVMAKFDSYEDSINWMDDLEKEAMEAMENEDEDRFNELEKEYEEMEEWLRELEKECAE